MTQPCSISPGQGLPWWRSETLMSRIDAIAREDPNRIYAAYPRSPLTYDEGFREVTYAELANAVNGLAQLLETELGVGENGETLAYIGPNDVRYTALILGAAKAGYKMLLISPRNSVAAQFHLFDATKCKTILSPSPQLPQITAILEAGHIRCVEIPSVSDLLDKPYPPHPYTKTFEEAKGDDFFVVHTSGSTGMPKPLAWNHQFVSTNIEHMQADPPPGYVSQDRMVQKNRVFITFPPFHGAFLAEHLFNAIPHGTVLIAPTSGAIATGQGLVDALKYTRIDVAFLVPSIALDLAQAPDLLAVVAEKCERILYCGGDLPQAIGDKIVAKIPLYNQYGASEMGVTPQIWGNRTLADWKYIEPHPIIGAEMRHTMGDLYEYNIVRKPNGEEQPATFSIFPELDAYQSRDLYVQHPANPKLWRWQARVDDVIVFLNGEKTNPNSMEQHILTKNRDVARVLVAGSQRFQAALMIQPVDNTRALNTTQRAAFIERLWPTIEEANQVCPAHAKIAKSHILFTTPDKPMMVAGKGTIQRAGTVALYEKELDTLYADADAVAITDGDSSAPVVNLEDSKAVSAFIKQTILEHSGLGSLGFEDNLFTLGMDSLQALQALRALRRGLRMSGLALSTIYTNPSVSSLTLAVVSQASLSSSSQHEQAEHKVKALQVKLDKYKAEIDRIEPRVIVDKENDKGIVILLTGSTGAFGCHLLQVLLSNPSIRAVHCLNRGKDGGAALQSQRLARRGLPSALATDRRVSYYHVDLANKNLDLSPPVLGKLRDDITHIIHAAWLVDFNVPLDTFDAHLQGVVNLTSLAASITHKVCFMFVSSISSVMSHHTSTGRTQESIVQDLQAPAPIGYGQSKFLGELLLFHASERLGQEIDFAIARVGQVAGAIEQVKSYEAVTWKASEWFPSLVLSSVYLGAMPASLGSMGRIDWVPINTLATVLTELMLSLPAKASDNHIAVYHPHNTNVTDWQTLRESIVTAVQNLTGKKLEVVPVAVWLDRVQKTIETDSDSKAIGMAKAIRDEHLAQLLKLNPAAKLLDWYREVLTEDQTNNVFDTTVARDASQTLRGLGALQDDWMIKWTQEWLSLVMQT